MFVCLRRRDSNVRNYNVCLSEAQFEQHAIQTPPTDAGLYNLVNINNFPVLRVLSFFEKIAIPFSRHGSKTKNKCVKKFRLQKAERIEQTKRLA